MIEDAFRAETQRYFSQLNDCASGNVHKSIIDSFQVRDAIRGNGSRAETPAGRVWFASDISS